MLIDCEVQHCLYQIRLSTLITMLFNPGFSRMLPTCAQPETQHIPWYEQGDVRMQYIGLVNKPPAEVKATRRILGWSYRHNGANYQILPFMSFILCHHLITIFRAEEGLSTQYWQQQQHWLLVLKAAHYHSCMVTSLTSQALSWDCTAGTQCMLSLVHRSCTIRSQDGAGQRYWGCALASWEDILVNTRFLCSFECANDFCELGLSLGLQVNKVPGHGPFHWVAKTFSPVREF